MLRLLLVLLLLIAGTYAAQNVVQDPPRSAEPTIAPAMFGAPPPTPGPHDASIEIDEVTMTNQVNRHLGGQTLGDTPLGAVTAKRLQVQLQYGQIIANGDAQVGGSTLPVTTTSVLDVQHGRPVVNVLDAKVGGIPLPGGVRQAVEKSIQQEIDAAVAREQVELRSVTIRDGKMTLVGRKS